MKSMKPYVITSQYRQFYVADAGLRPLAPEDWDDGHVQARHNTLENIAALCPEGDITARIYISLGLTEDGLFKDEDFLVETCITVPSGRVGIYEWPFETLEEHAIAPGLCRIRFRGYKTDLTESEDDYYLVEISSAQKDDAPAPAR